MAGLADQWRERRQAERMAHWQREYTPEPPFERRVFDDLSPEGQRIMVSAAQRLLDRYGLNSKPQTHSTLAGHHRTYPARPGAAAQASRQSRTERRALLLAGRTAAGVEGVQALLGEGFERLAERERAADERERFMVKLTIAGVAFGALCFVAAVAAIFAG